MVWATTYYNNERGLSYNRYLKNLNSIKAFVSFYLKILKKWFERAGSPNISGYPVINTLLITFIYYSTLIRFEA